MPSTSVLKSRKLSFWALANTSTRRMASTRWPRSSGWSLSGASL